MTRVPEDYFRRRRKDWRRRDLGSKDPFKAQIEAEVNLIFCNPGEFGELIELEGQEFIAVLEPLEIEQEVTEERRAVAYEGITIYCAKRDFPDPLIAGREISFNGHIWYVLDATDCEAMRVIKLYRERA